MTVSTGLGGSSQRRLAPPPPSRKAAGLFFGGGSSSSLFYVLTAFLMGALFAHNTKKSVVSVRGTGESVERKDTEVLSVVNTTGRNDDTASSLSSVFGARKCFHYFRWSGRIATWTVVVVIPTTTTTTTVVAADAPLAFLFWTAAGRGGRRTTTARPCSGRDGGLQLRAITAHGQRASQSTSHHSGFVVLLVVRGVRDVMWWWW